MIIDKEEFHRRLKAYLAEERAKEVNPPSGFFGNWAYDVIKEREFRHLLKSQGITVEE